MSDLQNNADNNAVQIQRVLLSLRFPDKKPVQAEVSSKLARYLITQPGISQANAGNGVMEVHYDANAITLTDIFKIMAKFNIMAGIT